MSWKDELLSPNEPLMVVVLAVKIARDRIFVVADDKIIFV